MNLYKKKRHINIYKDQNLIINNNLYIFFFTKSKGRNKYTNYNKVYFYNKICHIIVRKK